MTTLDDLSARLIGLKDNIDDQAESLSSLRESTDNLIIGLAKMLAIQAQHGAMLKEILIACTAKPSDENPLVEALQRLTKAVEAQGRVLAQIEAAVKP